MWSTPGMRWVAPPMPVLWCQCYWTNIIGRILYVLCRIWLLASLLTTILLISGYVCRHPGANILSIGKRWSDYHILKQTNMVK